MLKTQIIEALLFASDAPLSAADLARGDESLDEEAVEGAIQSLRQEYEQTGRSFQIYEIAGGYQLLTSPDYAPYLERFDTVPQSPRVSNPALEVLAVIAYRQPIDRAEIEEIRGVGSSGVLRTLQDRNLIEVAGRGEGLGRPLLYGTTKKFLEHFGFRSLEDLPRPDELPVVLRPRSLQPQSALDSDPAQLEVELPMRLQDADVAPVETEPAPEEIEAVIEAEMVLEAEAKFENNDEEDEFEDEDDFDDEDEDDDDFDDEDEDDEDEDELDDDDDEELEMHGRYDATTSPNGKTTAPDPES
jgi:segregation and condensation protein B